MAAQTSGFTVPRQGQTTFVAINQNIEDPLVLNSYLDDIDAAPAAPKASAFGSYSESLVGAPPIALTFVVAPEPAPVNGHSASTLGSFQDNLAGAPPIALNYVVPEPAPVNALNGGSAPALQSFQDNLTGAPPISLNFIVPEPAPVIEDASSSLGSYLDNLANSLPLVSTYAVPETVAVAAQAVQAAPNTGSYLNALSP